MKSFFIITASLLTILILLFSCNSSLKDDKLQTWFYGVPVYENANEIRKKLTYDARFIQQQSTDTTKAWYVYKGSIKRPYLLPGIKVPDSSTIEFSYYDYGSFNQQGSKDLKSTVKLLQIDYYYERGYDIENLFLAAYNDLKTYFRVPHNIEKQIDNKVYATGKEINYNIENSISQKVYILKQTDANGSKSLRIVLMIGEK